MKKTVLLLSLLAAANDILGQNIDREPVDIQYVLLPKYRLPDSTETYYVSVKNRNTIWGNSLGNSTDEDALQLNGYYRLKNNYDADVLLDLEVVKDLQFVRVELVKSDLTYKPDKKTEIAYTAYTYTVRYISPQVQYRLYTGNDTEIDNGVVGGDERTTYFGSTGYESSYKNEYTLSRAWGESKRYELAKLEASHYKSAVAEAGDAYSEYCLNPAFVRFRIKYVKERKSNDYDDLRRAKNFFTDAAELFKSDAVVLINKMVQPDYNNRNTLLDSAINIWQTALKESDLKDRKARIDQKVTRHIYYNLAFAYVLKNDFDKAQQYLQGREDEETNDVPLKNTFAGMKNLSAFIDRQKERAALNKWRELLLKAPEAYVYKDPASRKKEKEEANRLLAAKEKVRIDSLNKTKKGSKSPVKKVSATKSTKTKT